MIADWDGSILIGPIPDALREKEMPGDEVEELENSQILHSPSPDLLDEAPTVTGKPVVLYRASCHPRISSRVV